MNPNEVFTTFQVEDEQGPYMPSALVLSALQMAGYNPPRQSLQEIIQEVDINGDGRIEFPEFQTFCEKMEYTRADPEALLEAFKVFDLDGSGYLDRKEFAMVMATGTEPLSSEELNRALALADKDGDGKIDYEEFVAWLCNCDPSKINQMKVGATVQEETRKREEEEKLKREDEKKKRKDEEEKKKRKDEEEKKRAEEKKREEERIKKEKEASEADSKGRSVASNGKEDASTAKKENPPPEKKEEKAKSGCC